MKLSISVALLNHISTSFISTALNFEQTRDAHKGLQALIKVKNEHYAKIFGTTYEEFIKEKEERNIKKRASFLKAVSFVDRIKAKANKYLTIEKTETEITIDMKDEFIQDCFDSVMSLLNKTIPITVEADFIFTSHEEEEKELRTKWEMDKKENIETELTEVNQGNWKFTIMGNHLVDTIKVDDQMMKCPSYLGTDGKVEVTIYPHDIKNILDDNFHRLNKKYSKDLMEALVGLSELVKNTYIN